MLGEGARRGGRRAQSTPPAGAFPERGDIHRGQGRRRGTAAGRRLIGGAIWKVPERKTLMGGTVGGDGKFFSFGGGHTNYGALLVFRASPCGGRYRLSHWFATPRGTGSGRPRSPTTPSTSGINRGFDLALLLASRGQLHFRERRSAGQGARNPRRFTLPLSRRAGRETSAPGGGGGFLGSQTTVIPGPARACTICSSRHQHEEGIFSANNQELQGRGKSPAKNLAVGRTKVFRFQGDGGRIKYPTSFTRTGPGSGRGDQRAGLFFTPHTNPGGAGRRRLTAGIENSPGGAGRRLEGETRVRLFPGTRPGRGIPAGRVFQLRNQGDGLRPCFHAQGFVRWGGGRGTGKGPRGPDPPESRLAQRGRTGQPGPRFRQRGCSRGHPIPTGLGVLKVVSGWENGR